ncbi:hypothetical protein HYG93_07370 [Acinetobacter sp. SwsAc6]|uniref:hypothetical protein n=1 Tax=Acinetobacter TaxID=469 RepID=UPI000EA25CEA|nr:MULTISPECIES: hypothetical protein [Acinetobacter]NWK74108.1 hypothetical protein [Acinetobacter sp. SwsAc6]RKG50787.1 hypothetical protein D7V68_02460 [Acinetobacter cumulans]
MDITEQQQELIESGEITPELASQLLIQEMNGDTTASNAAETGSEPDTTQDGKNKPEVTADNTQQTQEQQQQQTQADESQMNAENAVIVAKDGKHTIPYEKLVEARNGEKEWKQKFDASQQQLAELQANAQERKDNGVAPTVQDNQADIAQQAIDQGVDPAIFGDFDEKGLADGIQKLVDMRVSAMVQQKLDSALAPMQQQQQVSAEHAHFNTIFTAHPDAESIVESKEFSDWLDNQPNITKDAYKTVLDKGSASQVVELLGLYKSGTQSTQAAQQQQNTDAVRAAAMQAVNKAPTKVPHSVTDFPSGNPTGQSNDERLANLSGPELLAEMSNWTDAQIDAYYARNA